jgi:hypothetical protein
MYGAGAVQFPLKGCTVVAEMCVGGLTGVLRVRRIVGRRHQALDVAIFMDWLAIFIRFGGFDLKGLIAD